MPRPKTGSAHVGFVSGVDQAAAADFTNALRDGMTAFGYAEPRGLTFDLRFADYHLEHIPALVAELEARRVDVIVTHAAATLSVVKGRRSEYLATCAKARSYSAAACR